MLGVLHRCPLFLVLRFELRDRFNLLLLFFHNMIKLPRLLQVQPKLWTVAEESRKSKGGTWCNTTFPIDQFIDSLIGNVNPIGKLALWNPHRLKEILEQYLSRVRWCAVLGILMTKSPLMVINNLNLCGSLYSPPETDSILVIHSNTVLSFALTFQTFKSIPGGILISSKETAAFNRSSFRRATSQRLFGQSLRAFFESLPSKMSSVSLFLNDSIIIAWWHGYHAISRI